MPDWMDEAKNLADEHSDVADKGFDEAAQFAEDKTGGKFDSQEGRKIHAGLDGRSEEPRRRAFRRRRQGFRRGGPVRRGQDRRKVRQPDPRRRAASRGIPSLDDSGVTRVALADRLVG